MKTSHLIAAALCLCTSCSDLFQTDNRGTLQIWMPDESLSSATKSLPDVNSFILSVKDSKGASVYYGSYGMAPESMLVSEGEYTVTAMSREFREPAFDSPQYGDTQKAQVVSGKKTVVDLLCYQLNSGIRLKLDSSYKDEYPAGILFLRSSEGSLMYSQTEKRTAYFNPGPVSLVMKEDDSEKTLMTRSLTSQQILTVNVSVAAGKSSNQGVINVSVDTSVTRLSEDFVIGGRDSGTEPELSYNVATAKQHIGECDVWVEGYIVGGDLSSTNCSFDAPFKSRTNLVLSSRGTCRDKNICLSVQLSKGDVRDEINLVDHEEYLGRQICLKGDIVESYYGIPGLQNISEYKWK